MSTRLRRRKVQRRIRGAVPATATGESSVMRCGRAIKAVRDLRRNGRLASNLPLRQASKGTRLPGGGCPDRVAGVDLDGQERAWTHAEGPTATGGTIKFCPIKTGRGSGADAGRAGVASAAAILS
jgi:hypothetical protein